MMFRLVFVMASLSMVSMDLMLQAKLNNHWDSFKAKHGKSYKPEEESVKKENFKSNVERILNHNLKADLGEKKYRLSVNEFSDMSSQEFGKSMLGLKMPSRAVNKTRVGAKTPLGNLPRSVDWRSRGVVTHVKNQGNCGSCWSFAVAGALEGAWAKSRGQRVILSEQNLVDCASQSAGYSNMGCEGGFPDDAFQYIVDNGGLDLASCYPYAMEQNECMFDPGCVGATMSRYVDIMQGDEQEMKEAVASYGPVSVGLDAGQPDFQGYSSGVYSDDNCQQQGNHAVLVVGYGNEGGEDYWLIKNSWGTSWGEQGFMKLARNADNMCGVTNAASYPIV